MLEKFEDKLNIGIRADGNSQIGLGHIIRTMALAREFQKNNHGILYWVKENPVILKLLKQNNFDVLEIDSSLDINKETELINSTFKKNKIDIFIGDAAHIDQVYLDQLNRANKLVVLLDVLKDMKINADLIISGGIHAVDYQREAERFNRNVLLGSRYVLLREQFNNCKPRCINRKVSNVLITMGGADVQNLTPTFIRYISQINNDLMINVVIGNAFKNKVEISEIANKLSNVYLHHNVQNMADLMYENDIAISAGGTTLYELSATGTPTMAVIQAENQILQTTRFQNKGIVINLGYGDKLDKDVFADEFILINDWEKRKRMSALGQSEVDGKGVQRCYKSILKAFYKLI